MPDETTLQETVRSSVDGTEFVRLSTGVFPTGVNWRAQLSAIFAALGSGGAPGSPAHSVQFNNPLGTFAGSADLLWTTGVGLTLGGASQTLGVITPGAGEHQAIGKYATIDCDVFAPGDAVNGNTEPGKPITLNVVDYYTGDLSTPHSRNTITAGVGLKHTGTEKAYAYNVSSAPVINSDSTGPWAGFGDHHVTAWNYGSGAIDYMTGINVDVEHLGPANIDSLYGIEIFIEVYHAGGTATATTLAGIHIRTAYGPVINNYGLWVEDQHGAGSSRNYNIYSSGAASRNVFEGTVNLDPGATNAVLANGDLWFNGANLNFRHAGITTDLLAGSAVTTIGALPAAGSAGRRAFITDSLAAPVFAATLTAGGTFKSPVYDDGAAWRYG